jgi:hypothetical protein
MSDEQRRQEQERIQVAQAEAQPAETTGDRWGDPISAERQAELQGYLDRWAAETDHGERAGPFDNLMARTDQKDGCVSTWSTSQ